MDPREQRALDELIGRVRTDPGQRTFGQLVQEREQAALMLEKLRRTLVSPESRSQDRPTPPASGQPEQPAAVSKKTYPAGALLRMKSVKELIGVSAGTIYKWIGEGTFPKPVRIGERSVRWRLNEVEAWRDGLSARGSDSDPATMGRRRKRNVGG